MDASKATIIVSLDLSVAFDTISHSVLLNHLEVSFNFLGSVLLWIDSYLTNLF